jgi:hypothetical protein
MRVHQDGLHRSAKHEVCELVVDTLESGQDIEQNESWEEELSMISLTSSEPQSIRVVSVLFGHIPCPVALGSRQIKRLVNQQNATWITNRHCSARFLDR